MLVEKVMYILDNADKGFEICNIIMLSYFFTGKDLSKLADNRFSYKVQDIHNSVDHLSQFLFLFNR